jgi:hypothetical protein
MANCPKCKKEIDCLHYDLLVEESGRYTLENGHGGQGRITIAEAYMCPECEVNLYANQDEASQLFKKGG